MIGGILPAFKKGVVRDPLSPAGFRTEYVPGLLIGAEQIPFME